MTSKITLIADSGSSKTDWKLFIPDEAKVYEFRTKGLNPYYLSAESIYLTIEDELELPISEKKIEGVIFFGAGCSTESKRKDMKTALIAAFPNAEIDVKSDIEGAALGICPDKDGIVCISGTGSNACVVHRGKIVERAPSLGIWLGDEGSAGHIGKQLLSDYLAGIMPPNETQLFQKKYPESKEGMLDNVYRHKFPNKYLASFAVFASENVTNYTQQVVKQSYQLFVEKYLLRLPAWKNYPVFFVGKTASVFSDIVREVIVGFGGNLADIIETPIHFIAKSYYKQN
ncbi:MAG: N-acetylglucosamine kinase [Cytophagales bacterium]|nr:N-acetylglucosamine kinase [Cytophagales bacterium]MDW8383281.1 N-acetylglucosamine kinase [Flammeovirgaceae bacterium]